MQEEHYIDAGGRECFKCSERGANGAIYSQKVIRGAFGWSPSWDEVRANVIRAARTPAADRAEHEGETHGPA